jgi:AI-2 transport protein TqsA
MKLMRLASILFIVTLAVAMLMLAQDFLIPIVVAASIFFMINSLAALIVRLRLGGIRMPVWLCRLIAMVTIVAMIVGSIEIIIGSINGMMVAAPAYQRNLTSMFDEAMVALHLQDTPTLGQLVEKIDFAALAASLGSVLSSMAGSMFLVLFYVLFMLLEQNTFPQKWRATFRNKESRRLAGDTFNHISESIRNYITYKTGINLGTAILNGIIIWLVDVDFPLFWAFFIFIINWIPTIGSLFSATLPSLFALVQFNSWTPALVTLIGIISVQTVMVNILEPRVLGKLLNISGLVVMLSLVLWGMIWGIVGMILSVPIMVSTIIILSNFESTRPIALWLSADGKAESLWNK